ncbi:ABC transporter permease [Pseudactinotalea sp. Z1748]|uniref:ABC transporter permease n=1 Tax=Pseudactinotalea sp. Z1748 TaxID=3413027 RepID=UPI003C7C1297
MTKVGERPSLTGYLRELWDRRSFLWVMASSRSYSRNQNNVLGQLWTVLSPLTLAAVYFVVFQLILDTSRGVDNFVGFLTIGIFIFLSFAATVQAGANAILSNLNVVRALQFPRAILPMSVALSEMLMLLPAMAVMVIIVLVTGEPVSWSWLLLPVALAIILIFTAGLSMLAARIVVAARDLRNLIPVSVRMFRYISGVFFLIPTFTSGVFGLILMYQPVAVYLTLVRTIMLDQFPLDLELWLVALGWAVGFFVVGFLVFWQGEEQYGRD